MGKRLTQINVENVEENRRQYRHLLFTAGDEMGMFDQFVHSQENPSTSVSSTDFYFSKDHRRSDSFP